MSKVPQGLRAGITAVLLLTGVGGGTYLATEHQAAEMERNEYVQAVAADTSTSLAVRLAMVMGAYYESSYRHIGTPYVDRLGKGQPLTVCNGITGPRVIPTKVYSPSDCYELEKAVYLLNEREVRKLFRYWDSYDPLVQATFLDFALNKGLGSLASSTMLRLANSGDLNGACLQNPRWNRGTVKGVSTVLPGLVVRGEANAEICSEWRTTKPTPAPLPPPTATVLPNTDTVTVGQVDQATPCSFWCRVKRFFQ